MAFGTVWSMSSSSELAPSAGSISRTSSSEGPMWRRAKRSGWASDMSDPGVRTENAAAAAPMPALALVVLLLDVLLVRRPIHQALERRAARLHLDHPAAIVRIVVERLGSGDQGVVA